MSKREEIEYKLLKIEYFSCIFLILFFTIGFILLRIYINLITPSSAIEFLFSQNSSKRLYMSILLLVVVMIPSYIFFNAILFVKYFGLKLTKTFLSSLISFIIATLLIFIFVERLGIGFVLSYFLIVPIIHYIDLKTKKEFLPKNVYKIYTTYYGSPFKRILFRRLVPEIG